MINDDNFEEITFNTSPSIIQKNTNPNVTIPDGKDEIKNNSTTQSEFLEIKRNKLNKDENDFDDFLNLEIKNLIGNQDNYLAIIEAWFEVLKASVNVILAQPDKNKKEFEETYTDLNKLLNKLLTLETNLNRSHITTNTNHVNFENNIGILRKNANAILKDIATPTVNIAIEVYNKLLLQTKEFATDKRLTSEEAEQLEFILTGFKDAISKATPNILEIFKVVLGNTINKIKSGELKLDNEEEHFKSLPESLQENARKTFRSAPTEHSYSLLSNLKNFFSARNQLIAIVELSILMIVSVLILGIPSNNITIGSTELEAIFIPPSAAYFIEFVGYLVTGKLFYDNCKTFFKKIFCSNNPRLENDNNRENEVARAPLISANTNTNIRDYGAINNALNSLSLSEGNSGNNNNHADSEEVVVIVAPTETTVAVTTEDSTNLVENGAQQEEVSKVDSEEEVSLLKHSA